MFSLPIPNSWVTVHSSGPSCYQPYTSPVDHQSQNVISKHIYNIRWYTYIYIYTYMYIYNYIYICVCVQEVCYNDCDHSVPVCTCNLAWWDRPTRSSGENLTLEFQLSPNHPTIPLLEVPTLPFPCHVFQPNRCWGQRIVTWVGAWHVS